VALDLGRTPVMMVVGIPMIVVVLQAHAVWPRAGYAREPRAFVAATARLFGVAFLLLLILGAVVDTSGMTGPAGARGEALTPSGRTACTRYRSRLAQLLADHPA